MRKQTILGALAVVAFAATAARSTDFTIPLKINIIKSGAPLFKFVSKGTFTLPSGSDDPTVGGASLRFDDTGTTFIGGFFVLAAPGWTGLGNPAGSKGFKYKGAGSPTDPCKVVLIKGTVIKAVCKATHTFVGPALGTVATRLKTGTNTRYCGECGGTIVKNQAQLFKAKDCPPPGSCFASPSGAFLSDSDLF